MSTYFYWDCDSYTILIAGVSQCMFGDGYSLMHHYACVFMKPYAYYSAWGTDVSLDWRGKEAFDLILEYTQHWLLIAICKLCLCGYKAHILLTLLKKLLSLALRFEILIIFFFYNSFFLGFFSPRPAKVTPSWPQIFLHMSGSGIEPGLLWEWSYF